MLRSVRSVLSLLPLVLLLGLCAGCATLTGNDPGARSPGTIIDDQAVESLARRELLNADPRFEAAHFEVVSFDGVVLIAGQVESEDMLGIAEREIGQLRNVRTIHNELTVGGPVSMVARSNDAWLTTKVKSKLIAHDGIDSDRIKVVTENGVVYLIGKVKRDQADYAVAVAATVHGAVRIVKVFEYVD